MEKTQNMNKNQMPMETWANLPTEPMEMKPKVNFDINIPVDVEFLEDEPKELMGESGAYYLFSVRVNGEDRVLMTSAWTLMRALKIASPLSGKRLRIVKKLLKDKQQYEVMPV